MNQPPDILVPQELPPPILALWSDENRITVVAHDPEDEHVYFLWEAPPGADCSWTSTTEGDLWMSTATIISDPALDGQQLKVLVTDTHPGPPNRPTITWTMEVP